MVSRISHKDVLLAAVGVALIAFAFAGLVNASELRASYSSISLTASRTASVFVYAKNSDAAVKTIRFYAESASGALELYFDYYDASLAPFASRGVNLRVSAPANARGCDLVTVTATVCDSSPEGACETLSKTIRVFVSPSRESNYYVEFPLNYCLNYFEPAARISSNRVASHLEFEGYFDATRFDARFIDVFGVSRCKKVKPGEFARFPVSLRNTGAATSFDIRLIGDKDVLNAEVSSSFASLQRNEIAEFSVSVSPTHYAAPGRYHVVVQAQRGGIVLAEKEVCVEVEHEYDVRLSVPSEVEASTCGVSSFEAQVENTGTGRDIFEIDVSEPDWALVATRNVEARAGQKQIFEVKIDGTRLDPGVYHLGIKATSGENFGMRPASDKAFVLVKVTPCIPEKPLSPAQASVKKEEKDEVAKLLVTIENPSDAPIDNVSVSLEGLPEKWSYVSESGFVVPPHSNKTLTVLVKRTTDEEAKDVMLKIKSGDKVVGVQTIPKIESRASGLTGFFVAAGANAWIIALIIAIALAVVVLSGRLKTSEEATQEELYEKKLLSLKTKLSAAASEKTSEKLSSEKAQ
ncbi:MAG: hypothetical protein QW343_01190 [Candidatus Norongarragalinales archaeon]